MENLHLEKSIFIKDIVNTIDNSLNPLLTKDFKPLSDNKYRLHFSEEEFVDLKSTNV